MPITKISARETKCEKSEIEKEAKLNFQSTFDEVNFDEEIDGV